jgi:hypothetical protein
MNAQELRNQLLTTIEAKTSDLQQLATVIETLPSDLDYQLCHSGGYQADVRVLLTPVKKFSSFVPIFRAFSLNQDLVRCQVLGLASSIVPATRAKGDEITSIAPFTIHVHPASGHKVDMIIRFYIKLRDVLVQVDLPYEGSEVDVQVDPTYHLGQLVQTDHYFTFPFNSAQFDRATD